MRAKSFTSYIALYEPNYCIFMPLFCLSHNLVYLVYFCPSLDKIFDISKINKQGCGLARNGHGNAMIDSPLF